MGIVKLEERKKTELEEFRRMLLASVYHRKKFDGEKFPSKNAVADDCDCDIGQPVCVTSGLSFLGVAVVDRLLSRGYAVRIIVDNSEDLERIEEMNINNSNVSVIMASVTEIESLEEAFKDCLGVFHTSAFIDPNGLSGYMKYMVDLEARASENVMKACARTPSVKKCVMTSSLLACIWRDIRELQQHNDNSYPIVINHDSWSDESLCLDKKLWYALGKVRAEKAAWRVAKENGLNMASICPALITGPQFCSRNSTPTFAYLKGAKDMYEVGVLATVDVNRLAEAHVCVFETMDKKYSGGRYICFDNVVYNEEDAEKLARETSTSKAKICGTGSSSSNRQIQFELSDRKLSRLMSTTIRPCYNESVTWSR